MMHNLYNLLCSAILPALAAAAPWKSRGPPGHGLDSHVELDYGTYQGIRLGAGVTQYLGMRFAAPPLGDLRWRAPADPDHFQGVQNATDFQPICLSIGANITLAESEDCLFINVFAPSNATRHSKLPVWFYIQGGGYISNANANYNGTDVVVQSGLDIILVNFNYRVGLFGFLASENVRNNGSLNAGLLDERKALYWVQKYIHLFGGDPSHVVIHGASAGAGSVALQLVAYGGKDEGLFVGAVGQSPFFPSQPPVSQLEWQYDRYVADTGCNTSTNSLTCLRSKDTATLQAANIATPFPGQTEIPLFYTTPTIDSDILPDSPYTLFRTGQYIHVPLIIGDETNEGSYFAANASNTSDVSTFFTANYPLLTPSDTSAINTLYPLMPPLPEHAAYFPSASAAYGESTFVCPGIFMCESLSSVEAARVWNYRFDVTSAANVAAGLGVPHTYDTGAIFGADYDGAPTTDLTYLTTAKEVVPELMGYYISFVKTLDPNADREVGSPVWETFLKGDGGGEQRLLVQINGTGMENVPGDQRQRCAFWDGLAGVMEQ